MTTATASSLPEILDADDGVTYPRAAALLATRLFCEATFTLLEDSGGFPLTDMVADWLGGEQWLDVAGELVDEALKLGPVTRAMEKGIDG